MTEIFNTFTHNDELYVTMISEEIPNDRNKIVTTYSVNCTDMISGLCIGNADPVRILCSLNMDEKNATTLFAVHYDRQEDIAYVIPAENDEKELNKTTLLTLRHDDTENFYRAISIACCDDPGEVYFINRGYDKDKFWYKNEEEKQQAVRYIEFITRGKKNVRIDTPSLMATNGELNLISYTIIPEKDAYTTPHKDKYGTWTELNERRFTNANGGEVVITFSELTEPSNLVDFDIENVEAYRFVRTTLEKLEPEIQTIYFTMDFDRDSHNLYILNLFNDESMTSDLSLIREADDDLFYKFIADRRNVFSDPYFTMFLPRCAYEGLKLEYVGKAERASVMGYAEYIMREEPFRLLEKATISAVDNDKDVASGEIMFTFETEKKRRQPEDAAIAVSPTMATAMTEFTFKGMTFMLVVDQTDNHGYLTSVYPYDRSTVDDLDVSYLIDGIQDYFYSEYPNGKLDIREEL